MTSLEASVVEAAGLLDELSIPYMLIGGLAVAAWGEARATLDVDLSLWVEPEQFESTIQSLCARLKPLPSDPLRFATETRVLPLVSSAGVRLDLVFASLPAELELIQRAEPKALGGLAVRVAAVEDLIWMKLISERSKDLEDARRLIRRFRRQLDRDYLEPKLKELAEAFVRPNIIGIYQEEIGDN